MGGAGVEKVYKFLKTDEVFKFFFHDASLHPDP